MKGNTMLKRTFLATLGILLATALPALAQCDPSPGFDNAITLVEGGVEVVFATNGSSFALDDTVKFEIIFTNTTAETIVIPYPVTPPLSIRVAPVACPDILVCTEDYVFALPSFFMYVNGEVVLAPGECEKWNEEWDLNADPAAVGPYQVWGGLFAFPYDGNTVNEWILPSNGAGLLIDVQETVSSDSATLDRMKTLFR